MADDDRKIPNLKSFSAYRDENGLGQGGEPTDRPRYDDRLGQLSQEPTGHSEEARLASGFTMDDATAATEAQTPAETIARLGDASLPKAGGAAAAGGGAATGAAGEAATGGDTPSALMAHLGEAGLAEGAIGGPEPQPDSGDDPMDRAAAGWSGEP